jgi:hypothetical protein
MQKVINTGKVRIGAHYYQQARVDMDADALRLQDALLNSDRGMDPEDKTVIIACAIFGVAFAVMALAGWLPGGGA